MKKHIAALSLIFSLSTGAAFSQGHYHHHDCPDQSREHIMEEEYKQIKMKIKYTPAEDSTERKIDQMYHDLLKEQLDTLQKSSPPPPN